MRKVDRLWFYPPPPAATCNNKPKVGRYFAHRLFLWMPKRLWQVVITCPNQECHGRELTNAGIYQRVRPVVDVSSLYYMAAEYLECGGCSRKYISWNIQVVQQLDVGHQMQFPAVLTYRYACDKDVVRLLRERGLGNSSTQIRKKLVEEHGETWMKDVALYLSDCSKFASASRRGLLQSSDFQHPPTKPVLPQAAWFMKVHALDVMDRKDEMLSSITLVFGSILKMDSTKKVVKKLAGRAAGTASWQTNVGNEHGQVLVSVLTAGEGCGLGPMAQGLMQRYATANVQPPKVLYVDKDCCGGATGNLFPDWGDMCIRLDVWHYMRRLTLACTTESHQLYSVFMARLSGCIFEWSHEDLALLKTAKQQEIAAAGAGQLSPLQWISKRELALHCRRRTRGAEKTESLLQELLEHFSGDAGLDTMGVPLIDKAKVWEIWESQKRHIPCIQDPAGIQLYTKTGNLVKGGVELPTFRCARGSTSLESFHLHLNRFIPGTAARDEYYQAYLIEGLLRWNENRAAVVKEDVKKHLISRPSYDSKVLHSINRMGESVLGEKLFPNFNLPMKYTGELVGVEYLYSQTGQVLQDLAESAMSQDDDTDTAVEDDLDMNADDDQEDPTINMPSSPVKEQQTGPVIPQDPELDPAGWRRVRRRLQLQKGQSRGSATASSSTGPLTATASSSTTLAPATTSSSTALPPATASSSESQPPATVTAPESTPPRSPLLFSQETLDSEPSDSEVTTGPDSIPGYDAVEHLAEYLVELRHDCRALTMSQAAEICKRWNCLHDYDKRVTKFSPRHKANLTSGRFKVSKSPTKAGVDSTKRCFLGGNTGPAQWPDCNRIVEAVVIMLCSVFPSPVREGGMVTMRWTLVTRAYKNIREKVIQCPGVMQKTTLQLVAINNTTLTQWFNRREKKLEKEVLSQGVTLEQPSLETSESLMEPVVMPKIQAIPAEVERHLYILPQNTAGMGRKPRARMPRPILPETITRPVSAPIPIPVQMATPFISPPAPKLSRTAEWYRKRKEKDTGKTVRTYTRSDTPKTCGKCGQPRTAETGHKQYKGNWHCSTKDSISYEEMKQACMLKFQQLKNLQKK
ncbi:hypothetical protein FSP39_010032 [Pinctada imbricata]|uniref:DUF6729 domain-containing protein n=1 Tax=Pinctada imbricata TaxID=66713 RepID=A0AA88XZY6_PINIB|nr:hypothetical protein FSP39_010032 [Pinctada imbricata]